eukprot:augustus_masked-scaffold_56-processed-gene-1.97-mRNA-1 protein AED:0.05 eAED:0.05 QI:0/-1/0/1/-1/1/1/0/383
MREFVDSEIMPHVDEWEKAAKIPRSAFLAASKAGLLQTVIGWPEEVCGPRPEGFDGLFLFIAYDELSRCASGGVVWGLVGGLGIGTPPLVHCDEVEHFRPVLEAVVSGNKNMALAVSEATAGSDVANLSTTARLTKKPDGTEVYVVNGLKKWITCGMFADYFTVAARTGDEGMFGIELILVEKSRKGVSVREMDCMGVKGSGTAFVEFDEVEVPVENLVGDVTLLLRNFVTERLGLAIQANRFARECLRESIEYIRRRRAFNKKLEDQPVVRAKISQMARKVLATHAYIESVVERVTVMEREEVDWFNSILRLGAEAALVKVQATNTFEFCAREAAHIHGGNSYVKGNRIESLYRHVLSVAIPGGSTAVLEDAAVRLALQGKL